MKLAYTHAWLEEFQTSHKLGPSMSITCIHSTPKKKKIKIKQLSWDEDMKWLLCSSYHYVIFSLPPLIVYFRYSMTATKGAFHINN